MNEVKPAVKRTVTALVVSDKMDKTIVVRVTTKRKHKTGKYITRSKKMHVHDEHNQCAQGDTVLITQTRPLSRKKSWTLDSIVTKAI